MRKTGYREVAMPGQVNEDEGQRHRIRPAGQPDQHTAAGRKQTLTPDGATDLLVKRSQIPNPKAQNPKPIGIWPLGFGIWICRRADSNRRPRAYETRALTG